MLEARMASTRRDVLLSTAALTGGSALGRRSAAAQSEAPAGAPATPLVCVADYREAARRRMARPVFEYVEAGAGDELTLEWNEEAFRRLRLRPRVLADVSRIDTKTRLLGRDLPFPLLLAPTAYHRTMHRDGELAVARGAGRAETTLVVSSSATTSVEEIASAATAPLWFQLYLQPEREVSLTLVRRAEAAGCTALCLTVDSPVSGPQNRIERAGFTLPPGMETPMNPLANRGRRAPKPSETRMEFRVRYPTTWADVEWLRTATKLPILLKGILDPADADRAVGVGVQGIIVSNHGARNLDTAPATIDVLPEIAASVAGRVPVLVDGGIRRGTDVLKALAMGATATLIGRPYLYGLGAAGADGVRHVIDILRAELEMAMALAGRASIASIDRSVVAG
jgi:4-hydroxymandelate oxidase